MGDFTLVERFSPPLGERPGIPAVDRHRDDGEAHIAIVSLFQGGQCHPAMTVERPEVDNALTQYELHFTVAARSARRSPPV